MILIPIVSFIIIEILLGVFYFNGIEKRPIGPPQHVFYFLRFGLIIPIFAITNGLLSYFVSRSILKPVKKLNEAALNISEGNLDFQITPLNNDELGKLAIRFEEMRKNLKHASDVQKKYENNRKELIANISHDLKTPITSIKGYVEGIRDGVANSPEKLDRYLQTIYTKTIDMDHLINELFLFSKLDLNRIPFDLEEVDLHNYLVDIIEELQFDLEKENISVLYENKMETKHTTVLLDREQLKRAFTNIVQNSLKYMDKEHKQLEVSLNEQKDFILVKIKDNGIGIINEAVPYIFDRFYRADPSRNASTGGTGLGLAITKLIVEEHGGEIWAESKLGEQTIIQFTLKKGPANKEIK